MTTSVVNALVPVVALLGLGWVLRRRAPDRDDFWSGAENLCYGVLLPALFFHGLATARLGELPVSGLAVVLLGSTLAVAMPLVALGRLLVRDGAAFTSVFQGGVRFNNYIGVTLATGLLGSDGVAYAALCNGILVPTVNVLSVLVFARCGGEPLSARATLRQVATNPLIFACVAGVAVHVSGAALPAGVAATAQALGAASMPLGLMCVGAALRRFTARRTWTVPVAVASTTKFVALPAAGLLLAPWAGLESDGLLAAMLFLTLPTASSSYLLARRLGGDAPLMAAIIAMQTVGGLATVPAVLAVTLAV
ncbi:AEC family transporter [Pseudonocardia nematodicida]|uniref:AEC family transporter n=1 Tax=Pseudonocardia nematodicida TaxID=1206997 RepID=A0ABV1KDY2_9PSEU